MSKREASLKHFLRLTFLHVIQADACNHSRMKYSHTRHLRIAKCSSCVFGRFGCTQLFTKRTS